MGSASEQTARFVARISRARRARAMSQQQLADAAGLTRQAVSKMETGQRSVGLDDAVALCEALGVSLAAMLSEEPMALSVQVPID